MEAAERADIRWLKRRGGFEYQIEGTPHKRKCDVVIE
jgi:hypothetical protein